MIRLHLDIETYSACDLKRTGVYRYAEDPSTELLCLCYAFDDEDVETWLPGQPLPERLVVHISSGGEVRAHNAQFERVVLNGMAGRKVGFPSLAIAQMRCTAAKCAASGLPRALGDAASAMGTHPKDDAGRMDMLALSKPRKGKEPRWTPENAPQRFANLYAYCADDVRAERDLDHHVPDLTAREQRVYELDQTINDRGVRVDLVAVRNMLALIKQYKDRLEVECRQTTGHSPSQAAKIAEWVRTHGYARLPDLQADTVRHAVKDPECPAAVQRVLLLFSTYNSKAVMKYTAMLHAVCVDGRLRGMFLYHGAGTGRWASLIVQLQNLFRPVIKDADTAIAAAAGLDIDWLQDLYPNHDPLKVIASCVRGMLVPAEGKELQSLDFASIESRVNAWLFDEDWKLQAFREFDAGTGPDLYCVAYGRVFRVAPHSIGENDLRRQLGKVLDLFGGYEGGVAAFVEWAKLYSVDLVEMASTARQVLPPDVVESAEWMWERFGRGSELSHEVYTACDGVKQLWRRGHPKIVAGWKHLKEAAMLAVQNPGSTYKIPNGKIAFRVIDQWLCMRLPSGRLLRYFRPEWDGEAVTYLGVDTDTRRWMRTPTYGGKLCENAVQAIARDLLVHGMFNLEAAGYPTVGTVHDEVLSEVVMGFNSLEDARRRMCELPEWAKGLPIAAEGWRAQRFRK